jgi:hypothetical protein
MDSTTATLNRLDNKNICRKIIPNNLILNLIMFKMSNKYHR